VKTDLQLVQKFRLSNQSIGSLLHTLYFSSSSAVSHIFSALCVYSTFGHHPHS